MFASLLAFLASPAFTLFANPASWAELIGAVLGVAMVLCNIRQIHWGWPLAFASSVLYCGVFAGSQLYGEAALQVFFAAAALWGWAQWLGGRGGLGGDGLALQAQQLSHRSALVYSAASLLLWGVLGVFLYNFTSTDVPWLDGFITALSIVATVLLGRKYIENWLVWMLVNAVSVGLFAYKGLWLTCGLYGLFLLMALLGWQAWRKQMRSGPVHLLPVKHSTQA